MKTIGLIGGMSWKSTVSYYQILNEVVKEQLGGYHSAKVLLFSVDFFEIEECQRKGEWDKSAVILAKAAESLERAGADFIVIATNTMHKVVPQIQERINIPILHIAEATAEELKKNRIERVGLLGTEYTMTQNFYKEKLISAGIEVLIPDEPDVEIVNRIIYDELCMGVILEKSKQEYLRIIGKFKDSGAQGVILGCTEIGLLVKKEDTACPLFDTTRIHAVRAAMLSINI